MRPTTLLVTIAAGVGASLSAGAEPEVPIFDGRSDSVLAQPTSAEAALLERVVRPQARAVWSGDDACSEDFTVVGRASGAFTQPGANQTAVLYRFCDIGRQNGMSGIAVLESGRVAAHVAFKGGGESGISALPDVDEDGLSEIAIASFGSGQGTMDGGVTVIELGASGVKKLGFFGTYHDNCGTDERRLAERASVLYAVPGSSPRFFIDRFTKSCGESTRWRASSARVPVLPENDDTSYRRIR
jgi:hypothetical protein